MVEEQLRELVFYHRSEAFDEKEKATIRYADAVTRGAAAISSEMFGELQKYYTDDEIVELTLVICVANFTNRFNDALQIVPDLG